MNSWYDEVSFRVACKHDGELMSLQELYHLNPLSPAAYRSQATYDSMCSSVLFLSLFSAPVVKVVGMTGETGNELGSRK